ncbi:MAG: hypothetical protein ACYTGN_11380 [Planctomycetota bacterium]
MIRTLCAALPLLAGLTAAAPEPVKDAFWGYEYRLEGMRRLLAIGDPALLMRGKAGALALELRVHEAPKKLTPAQWTDALTKGWTRKFERRADGFSYTESRAGFVTHVRRVLLVRDLHCFDLRLASGQSDAAFDAAAAGLKLAKRAPGTLMVMRVARESGRRPGDLDVLIDAGVEYVTGQTYRTVNFALAQRVFAQARARVDKEKAKKDRRWWLFEYAGHAFAEQPAEAFRAHRKAEGFAPDADKRRQSAYNAACAASRAKLLDEAFAALDRAYEGGKPVPDEHVSGDKDLENCRRDERWHAFWRKSVKGQ